MKTNNTGFTLIELMIVISIIGILATMAMPSFQDRVIRAQVKEAFQLATIAQNGIEEFYRAKGMFPKNNAAAGLPLSGKIIGNYVSDVEVSKGAIHITLGNRVNRHVSGKIISIRPAVVRDAPIVPIAWVYGYAGTPDGMTVVGENKSSVLPVHLPVNCRY